MENKLQSSTLQTKAAGMHVITSYSIHYTKLYEHLRHIAEVLGGVGREVDEEIILNWKKLESSTQKLDIGFLYPYLLKTNLGLDASYNFV